MKIKQETFHVFGTIANIHTTQEQINQMIEAEAFTKEDAARAELLLIDLGYEPDWTVLR